MIRQFLLAKKARHAEWRKKSKISQNEGDKDAADSSIIVLADLILADSKRFASEEDVADELIATFFGIS